MNLLSNAEKTRHLKTLEYREWYRKEVIPRSYHPVIHAGVNFGILSLLVLFHLTLIKNWTVSVLIVFGSIILLGNLTVWVIHKYPLHRRYKLWTYPFVAHTIEHHRYFTSLDITYDHKLDYYAIFFPMRVIIGFALVAQPLIFFSANYFWGPSLAHALAGAAAGYFLLYETLHWTSHLEEDHPLMKIPWIKYMREHHAAHHNPRLMNRYNFCIVYPLMDILLGTKYRGQLPEDNPDDHFQNVKSNLEA